MARSEAASLGVGALSPGMLLGWCCSRTRVALGCADLKCLSPESREKSNRGKERGITKRWSLPLEADLAVSEAAVCMANITSLGFLHPPSADLCAVLSWLRCAVADQLYFNFKELCFTTCLWCVLLPSNENELIFRKSRWKKRKRITRFFYWCGGFFQLFCKKLFMVE